MTLKMYDIDDVKFMFFCYLEGHSQAKRMFTDEKLPRHQYRRTSFRAWVTYNFPQTVGGIAAITDEDLEKWLTEYLATDFK